MRLEKDRFVLAPDKLPLILQTPNVPRVQSSLERAKRAALGIAQTSVFPRECKENEVWAAPMKRYRERRAGEMSMSPVAILDAPDLRDDFYLNILDWSMQNVVTVALDCAVYSYSYTTKKTDCVTVSTHSQYVSALRSVRLGSLLAVANCAGCISIIDAETGKEVASGAIPVESRVAALASKDSGGMFHDSLLLAGSRLGCIFAYDLRGRLKMPVLRLQGHHLEVCGMQLAPDSWLLASGGNDNQVLIWDLRKSTALFSQKDYRAAVKALSWCPWQRNLLATGSGTGDRRIRFWDTEMNACMRTIHTDSQVCSAVWSPTTTELITTHGYVSNELSIWQYPTLRKIASIPAHDSRILHSALSSDGTTVATTAANENLKFWELFRRRPLLRRPSTRPTEITDRCLFNR